MTVMTSPMRVVDFSALEKRGLVMKCGKSLAPPPDAATDYTDDSGSLSSVSSHTGVEARHEEAGKRTIFARYWEKSKLLPQTEKPEPISPPPRFDNPKNGRRSIFSDVSRASNVSRATSVPSLPDCSIPRMARRALSSPELEKQLPRGSCLKASRFSGSRRRASIRSDSSVSFDTNVDVLHYKPPVEIFAVDGWSKFFE